MTVRSARVSIAATVLCALLGTGSSTVRAAGATGAPPQMDGFDAYMERVLRDWNVPGIGVGVIQRDQLVFAKGYGYRDYGQKLPFTAETTFPIASNTKLFTAILAGMLVQDGKLDWDEPIRETVPSIEFYNDDLNRMISLRDMLSHRTGITRHDLIWYHSDFTRRELFERLKYLEPKGPIRTTFLYNNMMYVGVGYAAELVTGQTWETLVQTRLLDPLEMGSTTFTIEEMRGQADHAVPYTERRDSEELFEIPYYVESDAVGPAGAINSNLDDLSHWVIALMNGGSYAGRQILPPEAIKATLAPNLAMGNASLDSRGWGEVLNSAYGAGRWTASYRGHLLAYHGGDINGFHSQISCMPTDSLGVIVLVIGDHAAALYNPISYNVYERMLGLSETPWIDRTLAIRRSGQAANREARAQAGSDQVAGTKPSHPLDDYVGDFVHPAYGTVKISREHGALWFDFHGTHMALSHYHYDRFDTRDDEQDGKWSLNFGTSSQGEIDRILISLDEAEVTFTRGVDPSLALSTTLRPYAGRYLTASGVKIDIVLREDGTFGLQYPGAPFQPLQPWKPHKFRIKEFADVVIEFELEDGRVTALTQTDPSGRYRLERQ